MLVSFPHLQDYYTTTKLQWVLPTKFSDALKGIGSCKVLNKKGYKTEHLSGDPQPLRLLELPQVFFPPYFRYFFTQAV